MTQHLRFLVFSVLVALAGGLPVSSGRAEPMVDPARELPRVAPIEPSAALATWRVRPGFALQLAAHEPQVRSPVALSFDERGRLFVCEMIDYSEQREVTPHLGRVSRLEDRDGDGVFETSTVFADNLPWPTGLICARGGVYVAATPDVFFFSDTDDDGRADRREVAYTGFGSGQKRLNVQTLVNSLQWGLDNRIHLQTGGGHRGVITSPLRPDVPGLELAGRDFWFDPRTHVFGAEAGGAQYGMSFDSFGRRFACSNSDHLQFYVYDDTLAGPNPFFSLPAPRTSIAADGGAAEVFRISPDEPWRIVRTRWRVGGVVPGMVEGGGRVSGYFTGATGTTIYRGDALGADFPWSSFTGDAGGQLVHRKVLSAAGVSFVGQRPADEHGFEFAASTDPWVRVVSFANAPDGSLYLCDMYREVIEHPWSIPEPIKRHLDLNSGNDRGRIYRIVADSPDWRPRTKVSLDRAGTAELVALLAHPNGWHRDTASRLLYERRDPAAVPLLEETVQHSPSAWARAHALGALEGFGLVRPEILTGAVRDESPGVRERALIATIHRHQAVAQPGWVSTAEPELANAIMSLLDDPDPRVRFHLALASKSLGIADRTWVLGSLARSDAQDPWIGAAVTLAADALVFREIEADLDKLPAAWVATLIKTLAASGPDAELTAGLRAAAVRGLPNVLWLRALGEGYRLGGGKPDRLEKDQILSPLFARAVSTVGDASAPEAERLDAIGLLTLVSWERARPALVAACGTSSREAVQLAAVKALGVFSAEEVGRVLVSQWTVLKPRARTGALAVLLSRPALSLDLLHAIEQGSVRAADLGASEVESLWMHANPEVQVLARRALAGVQPATREQVLVTYQPAVGLRGDRERGRVVYQQRCQVCHRAAGEGIEVGPDLITVRSRGRDGLLTAIVDPHREVTPAYVAYTVNTREGATFLGLIGRDDASGMSLKLMGGIDVALARAAIQGTSSSGKSLMPEGLEAGLAVQVMADLLTFIEELK